MELLKTTTPQFPENQIGSVTRNTRINICRGRLLSALLFSNAIGTRVKPRADAFVRAVLAVFLFRDLRLLSINETSEKRLGEEVRK